MSMTGETCELSQILIKKRRKSHGTMITVAEVIIHIIKPIGSTKCPNLEVEVIIDSPRSQILIDMISICLLNR